MKHFQEFIYFDHASTSGHKPREVVQAMEYYLTHIAASPGRGGYPLQDDAYRLVSSVREQLAMMLAADKKERIIFTHNATHSMNIVLKGLLQEGDHVVISNFEHNCILRPLHRLSRENNVAYDGWEADFQGNFDLNNLEALIKPETKLIVLNHASNVIGSTSPVDEMLAIAEKHQIATLLDVSQTAGILPVGFADRADYIAGTGHKSLLGPTGIGFLYVKNSRSLSTLYEGGSGKNSKSPYQPETMPDKFEAGTMNFIGVAGLKGALDYINTIGISAIYQKVSHLTSYAIEGLKQIPGIEIYGNYLSEIRAPVVSFNLQGLFAGELAYELAADSICVRAGLHCAPLIHQSIGTDPYGTVRVSFGHKNTESEINQLIESINRIQDQYKLQRKCS